MAKAPTTTTPAPTPVMPQAEQTTTVSGYAIQILAFIPIGKKDLAKQVAIPTLLLDIQNGTKTIADLAPYLHDHEMRQNFINKRFPVQTAAKMLSPVEPPKTDNSEPMTDRPTLQDGDDPAHENTEE